MATVKIHDQLKTSLDIYLN